MDDVTAAKLLISCLDLTSLKDGDSAESISNFLPLSQTPYGKTAAVCLYQQFIPLAKEQTPKDIKIATVINFPSGLADTNILTREINTAIRLGADELDVVLPYRTFLAQDYEYCIKYLNLARSLAGSKTLKIIIESGELKTIENIKNASLMCIEAKADFIKTSTGKTKISATPEAANIILETIKQSGSHIGFKASGGIKTLSDAKAYLTLSQSIMGPSWVTPQHFRIGASSVLSDLIATIEKGY